jgi:phosphoribosylformylglycinamidine synthase
MALSEKHSVESTQIGEYNDSGYLRLDYEGRTCALVRMDLLESDFPQWEFEAEWTSPEERGLKEPLLDEPQDHGRCLKEMLSRPNICCRNWIARQYDHEVQGGSVIKPLVGKDRDMVTDAVVVMPVLTSNRGLAVTQVLHPFYSQIDTYHMTATTIDESVRKILSVGGDPDHLGGVDNFCWPTIQYHPEENPDGKYKAAQLVRSNWALRDYCLAFNIPLLSGKDSMYIDGYLEGPHGRRKKVSGMPTLLFTLSSVIEDVNTCVTMDVKCPGDLVYILGLTRDEMGGSEYYQMMGEVGCHVPQVRVEEVWPFYRALHQAIRKGLVASAHALSRGGLAVHLAMMAMGGELGMELDLESVPCEPALSSTRLLYSETAGRILVTVVPEVREAFEKLFSGRAIACIGRVTDGGYLTVKDRDGEKIIHEEVRVMKDVWKQPFGGLV